MKKLFLLITLVTVALLSNAEKKPKNQIIKINTTMGSIVLELYADVEKHTANFIKLVDEKFYDSLLFHRVIPSFMIQGGDPQSKNALTGQMLGNGDIGYKIPAEIATPKYYHKQGALAAARDNNPEKASSACQFYIVVGKKFSDEELTNIENRTGVTLTTEMRNDYKNIGGTPHLDGSYTVFGQVLEGQDVVNEISLTPRDASDRPKTDVMILSVEKLKKWEKKN